MLPPSLPSSAPKFCGIHAGIASGACPKLTTVGDATIDRLFWSEVATQQSFWNVSADVGIVAGDQCEGTGNAYATVEGQVRFGKRLMIEQVNSFGSMIPVHAILAHEFAHRLQFTHGWFRPGTTPEVNRLGELEADGWSGFYARWVKGYSSADFATHLETLYRLGDTLYSEPTHHGTSIERKYLALFGWAVANAAVEKGQTPTWAAIHDALVREIAAKRLVADKALEAEGFELNLLPPPPTTAEVQRAIDRIVK